MRDAKTQTQLSAAFCSYVICMCSFSVKKIYEMTALNLKYILTHKLTHSYSQRILLIWTSVLYCTLSPFHCFNSFENLLDFQFWKREFIVFLFNNSLGYNFWEKLNIGLTFFIVIVLIFALFHFNFMLWSIWYYRVVFESAELNTLYNYLKSDEEKSKRNV